MKQKFLFRHHLLFLIGLIACISLGCQQPEKKQAQIVSISWLKNLLSSDDASKLSSTYQVEGIFVNDPVPMLLTDIDWFRVNTPMPDSVFIRLSGDIVSSIVSPPDTLAKYFGNKVRMTVTIEKVTDTLTESAAIRAIVVSRPRVLQTLGMISPIGNLLLCESDSMMLCIGSTKEAASKVALLYSGGKDAEQAHKRYWNDLKFMYKTLKSKYSFSADNIVVVYKDGKAEDKEMAVNYAATSAGFDEAIKSLKDKIDVKSEFFLFVTNHGGGFDVYNRGGLTDDNNDEAEITNKTDETTFYFGKANTVRDDYFAQKINSLSFGQITAVYEQCYGGGFIRDLKGSKRVQLSASRESEESWGEQPAGFDTFCYHLTAALNKADHLGTAVDADTNNDNKVSILEAFLYAKGKDGQKEHPQLEDSGDGVSSESPSGKTGEEGAVAKARFL
jgi:hypothetical protein